ncbi:MAG: hypothetical protein NUW01_07470, partial [Gemmatimonadaceae bacterium]|nr:hypothetical protein [Gemmatimonadaceae bacterium]
AGAARQGGDVMTDLAVSDLPPMWVQLAAARGLVTSKGLEALAGAKRFRVYTLTVGRPEIVYDGDDIAVAVASYNEESP